jgi:uncharacterized protein (DUF4415 family)
MDTTFGSFRFERRRKMNEKRGRSASRDDIDAEALEMEDPRYWERANHLALQPDRESSLTEEDGAGVDWAEARVTSGDPAVAYGQKQQITVRIDRDVIDWFKSHGRGYQTRMNAALREYMRHHRS